MNNLSFGEAKQCSVLQYKQWYSINSLASPGKTIKSILLRELFHLCISEYGSVFADINISDVTPAALAESAFHTVFKRGYNIIFFKSEFFQNRKCIFNHNRRTADYCNSIFRFRRNFFHDSRYKTYFTLPIGSFTSRVNRNNCLNIIPALPLFYFIFID